MTVHFVVYDIATGTVQRAGICQEIDLERQAGPGEAVMRATANVATVSEINLNPAREAQLIKIDAEAEAFRLRFITPGAGQALTYKEKEAEVDAYLADPNATVPFLAQEAADTGETIAQIVAEVQAARTLWRQIGPKIEGRRRAAKKAVAAATNIAQIHAASTVDWDALLN